MFSISRRGTPNRPAAVSAHGNLSYADQLRALGQALETHDLLSFALQASGGDYLVRGSGRLPRQEESAVLNRLRKTLAWVPWQKRSAPSQSSEVVFQFPPERIRQLHREGRDQRVDGKRTPDPSRLSQVLRAAGRYLDRKSGVSLSEIIVEDRWVTFKYVTAEGRVEESKAGRDFLYDHSVKMYLRRRDPQDVAKTSLSPPTVVLH